MADVDWDKLLKGKPSKAPISPVKGRDSGRSTSSSGGVDWDSLLKGGGSTKKTGGASTARQSVDKAVGRAAESGDEGIFETAKGIGSKVGVTLMDSPVGRILDALSVPGSAVVSTVSELNDLTEGRGFSTKDIKSKVGRRYGVGDMIEEEAPDTNIWIKRLAGFAGDVVLDPLSYTGVGAVASKGSKLAKAGTRVTSREIAREAARQGEKELAERIARRGSGTLTKAEADKLGVKTGVQVGIGNAKVTVPGSRAASRALTDAAIGPLRSAARGSKNVTRLQDSFDPIPGMGELRRKDPVAAINVEDAHREAKGISDGIRMKLEAKLDQLHKQYKDVDRVALARALDYDDLDAKMATGPAFDDLREWFDTAADAVTELTGKQVARREDFLPRRMTNDFRKFLASQNEPVRKYGPSGKPKKQAFEQGREYRAGKKWLGVTLVEGSMKEMENIAKEVLGENYIKIFNEDPWQLAQIYAAEVSRSIRDGRFIKNLEDNVLIQKFDKKAYEKAVKRGERAEIEAARLRGRLEEVEDAAAAAREGADDLAARPNPQVSAMAGGLERAAGRADETALDAGAAEDALAGGLDELAAERTALGAQPPAPSRTDLEAAEAGLKTERNIRKTTQMLTKDKKQRSAALARVKAAKAVVDKEHMRLDAAKIAYRNWAEAAADIDKRATNLERELGKAQGRRATALAREKDLLERAKNLYEAAEVEGSGSLQKVARLEATALRMEARSQELGEKIIRQEAISRKMQERTGEGAREMAEAINNDFKEMLRGDVDRWADPEVVEVIAGVRKALQPAEISKFWKMHDLVLSRWKAYALLSPGFHSRNFLGGQFNNSLAGVTLMDDIRFLRGQAQLRRGGGDYNAIKDPEIRQYFQEMDELAVFTDTNIRDLADVAFGNTSHRGVVDAVAARAGRSGGKLGHLDPTNLENPILGLNRRAGNKVEKLLRGPVFIHARLQGKSAVDALHEVAKYHFDYDELAGWEKTWGKRALPFYTWTRKNLPLQLEMMVRKPGRYSMYAHAKDNMELGLEDDEMVPEYYGDLLAIKTPITTSGEGFFGGTGKDPVYATPDLPFRDLAESVSPSRALSSANPIFKTPIELVTNRSLFTGGDIEQPYQSAEPMPQVYAPLVPILMAANGAFGMPKIHRGPNGEFLMGRKDAYMIEQMLPALGKLRRLAPNEERYEGRTLTTWASTLGGMGARTLNDSDQYIAGKERQEAIDRLLREAGLGS